MAQEANRNNRGIRVSTNQPGDQPWQADGQLDVQFDQKNARQALPTVDALAGDGQFNFGPPRVDTGPVMDGQSDSAKQRESPPNPDFKGDIPQPQAGRPGETLDLAAVAPYRYPEFPADPARKTRFVLPGVPD